MWFHMFNAISATPNVSNKTSFFAFLVLVVLNSVCRSLTIAVPLTTREETMIPLYITL
ncbi:hypothetical protein K435DRAFT_435239 [Dendrothele bispora CBS 962.96]|uniref:Uncharacterized protein n=1 Tax=Dendrothele bispora (strain CBS 962.96) TaxID=1314807 RepID=A0A4S8L3H8_DENBC|nr:hypothetical protein K435DRAFT_435239 [Dendrothele bispora CBS 962.96]